MSKPIIRKIAAREILDSRGNPTVEVTVVLQDDTVGRQAYPLVPPPENLKHTKSGTEKKRVTTARGFCLPLATSPVPLPRHFLTKTPGIRARSTG